MTRGEPTTGTVLKYVRDHGRNAVWDLVKKYGERATLLALRYATNDNLVRNTEPNVVVLTPEGGQYLAERNL